MKTNNIFKALLLGGIMVGMTSCNDFLDQTSESEHNEENVYNSPYYTGLTLNKVYGGLTQDQTFAQVMAFTVTMNSDIELVDASKVADFTASSERGYMNYNAVAGAWDKARQAWDALYEGIEYCNRIVEGINAYEGIDGNSTNAKTMRQYRSEARTLRAMLYFDLVRNWGDVPLKTDGSKADLSNIYRGKTDRDVILDSLIVDLETALPDLPWVGESNYTTEHVTKGYAHALLAQIAMQRAGWAIRESAKDSYETATENSDPTYPTQRCPAADRTKYYKLALSHLNAVISSGKHALNPSFANEWYLVNQRTLDETYHENMFEIPMGLNKSGERGYTVGVRINGATTKYGSKGNSSGKVKTTAPFFMSYVDGDTRRDITCAPYVLSANGDGIIEKFDANKPFDIYIGKWDVRKMNEEWRQAALASTEKVPTGINEIRMRYPQVLLLYAECLNELNGNPDDATGGAGLTARQALNEVHCRAFDDADKATAKAYVDGIAADKDAFFAALVQENAWEFCGEGVRKYELERWNLLSSKIDEFKAQYTTQLEDGVYPEKLYYKTVTEGENVTIDMSSVCWKEVPSNTQGYESVSWWGTVKEDNTTRLPYISGVLSTTVKNRYLLPLATSTISDSQGLLKNSYGF